MCIHIYIYIISYTFKYIYIYVYIYIYTLFIISLYVDIPTDIQLEISPIVFREFHLESSEGNLRVRSATKAWKLEEGQAIGPDRPDSFNRKSVHLKTESLPVISYSLLFKMVIYTWLSLICILEMYWTSFCTGNHHQLICTCNYISYIHVYNIIYIYIQITTIPVHITSSQL